MATKVIRKPSTINRIMGHIKKVFGRSKINDYEEQTLFEPAEVSRSETELKFHLVSLKQEASFIKKCLKANKVSSIQSEEVADVLVAADYCGNYPYGIHSLVSLLDAIENRAVCVNTKPMILKQSLVAAWVNGKNALGPVVGNYCMDLAIKKAIQFGLGFVCVKNSNNIGMTGWYATKAANEQLIGIALSNDDPLMAAFNGVNPVLGANSIAFSAPCNTEQFNMDMCCGNISMEKFEHHTMYNKSIPYGWVLDDNGQPTNSIEEAHTLTPFGKYKGYGLAACIDILCGVLSGANYASRLKTNPNLDVKHPANLGQVFIAVDPDVIQLGFQNRAANFLSILRTTKPVNPADPVRVPGDKEQDHMREVDLVGGIPFNIDEIMFYNDLGERNGAGPLLEI